LHLQALKKKMFWCFDRNSNRITISNIMLKNCLNDSALNPWTATDEIYRSTTLLHGSPRTRQLVFWHHQLLSAEKSVLILLFFLHVLLNQKCKIQLELKSGKNSQKLGKTHVLSCQFYHSSPNTRWQGNRKRK
jgi:hypothetical protein